MITARENMLGDCMSFKYIKIGEVFDYNKSNYYKINETKATCNSITCVFNPDTIVQLIQTTMEGGYNCL